jgi:hypothetical protein
MHYFIFADKALCNEFVARTNLRCYDIIKPVVYFAQLPKKTTTLATSHPQPHSLLQEFLQNDYVCDRDPNTVVVLHLDSKHTFICV